MPILFNPGKKKGIFMIPSGGTKSPTPPVVPFSSTKSLEFDGIDDYVDCGDSDDFSFTDGAGTDTAFSISMWVYPTSNTGFPGFFDKTTGSGIEYGAYHWSTGMDFVLFDGNTSNRIARRYGSALALNTWQHLCFTYDGTESSSGMKIYLDGSVLTTGTNDAGVYAGMTNTDSPFIIGEYFSTKEFIGNIDEVAVWKNKELSAEEVSDIFNDGVPTDLTSLSPISWYRMGENSTFKSPQILMPEQSNKDKVSNYSMNFDGLNDTINCGNVTALNGLSGGSWSFWLNSNETSTQGILNQWGSGADALIYSFIIMSSGRLDIYFDGGAKYRVSGNTVINALNTGEWFNLVIVFDGTLPNNSDETGRLKVYINGTLLSDGFSFVTGPTAMPSTTSDLILGTYPSGTFWEGEIDEVAIWNNSLTQSEVTEIYNSGTPNDLATHSGAAALVNWWRMGEEAIFNSTNWLLPNKAQDVFSRYSLAFDGVNDYIECGDVLHNDGQTPMTVSAWVKITTAAGHTNSAPLANKKKVRMGPTYIMNGWAVNFLTSGAQTNKLHFELTGDGTIATGRLSKKALTLSFTDGLWHNIVVTYDGSENAAGVKFYIDGTEDTNTQTLQDTFSGTLPNDPTVDFQIGKVPKYGGTNYMDGNIDELAIFNSVKAIGDIWDGSGKPTDLTGQSGLVSWWRMGEDATFSTNWTVPDQIGSNNGTSANMTNDDLTGDAPGVSGNGTSANMTIEDRVGDAPDSSNNALSYNMDAADIVEEAP